MTDFYWDTTYTYEADWGSYLWTPAEQIPGAGDDVFFEAGTYVVIVNGSFDIQNMTLNSANTIIEGDVEAIPTSALNVSGTLEIDAGTIYGTEILNATIIDHGSPLIDDTLSSVTYQGILQVGTAGSTSIEIDIVNGLTVETADGGLPGQIEIDGDYTVLAFEDPQTLDSVTINFGTPVSNYDEIDDYSTGTLAFGQGVTIEQTGDGDAFVMEFTQGVGTGSATFDFQGWLDATDGSLVLYSRYGVTAANTFLNSGEVDVSGTATVAFQTSLVVNAVSGVITTYDDAQLDVTDTSEFDNNGVLHVGDNSTLQLTVDTLVNTGVIELASESSGSYEADFFVNQGTIEADEQSESESQFTLTGTDEFSNTADGLIKVTAFGDLQFSQASFDNQGSVIVNGTTDDATLVLSPLEEAKNEALFDVSADGTISVTSPGFTNTSSGTVVVDDGAVFDLSSTNWSNDGTMQVTNGGTLILGGSFTADDERAINAADGTILLTGVMDNTDNVFSIDDTSGSGTGTFVLQGGVITGGSVVESQTVLQSFGGVLSNVAFNGNIQLIQDNALLTLWDGSTVQNEDRPGTITVTGEEAVLNLANDFGMLQDQTLDSVSISLGSDNALAPAALEQTSAGEANNLVLGPDVTIDVVGAADISGGSVVNQGLINSVQTGLLVASRYFTNQGLIATTGSAPLGVFFGDDFTNQGSISINISDSAPPAALSPNDTVDNQSDGVITIENGELDAEPATFTNEGSIQIGTDGSFDVAPLGTVTNSGVIDDVGDASIAGTGFINDVDGWIDVEGGAYLQICADGWRNDGTILVHAQGSLVLGGYFTAKDAANIIDDGGTVTVVGTLDTADETLTISPVSQLPSVYLNNGTIGPQTDEYGNATAGTLVIDDGLGSAGQLIGFGVLSGEITDNGLIEANGGGLSLSDGADGEGAVQVDNDATLYVEANMNIGTLDIEAGGVAQLDSITLTTDPLLVEAGGSLDAIGTISGAVTNNGGIGGGSGDLSITDDITGDGTLDIGTGLTLYLDGSVAAGQVLYFENPEDPEGVIVGDPAAFQGNLTNFGANETIFLQGLTADAAIWSPGSLQLSDHGTPVGSIGISGDYTGVDFLAVSEGTDTAVSVAMCFLTGTQIRTPSGDVAIEQLSVGDVVCTWKGGVRRIVWIGHGQILATRGRRNAATPVIVRKNAIAPNVPDRDLRVTKGHSLFLDGVLIPVEYLVNHRSIVWDDHAQEVALYHLELDRHDVLVANGAPAESYRDDGNRWLFRNKNDRWGLPPQTSCAQVLTGGPQVDAVWRRLLLQSGDRPGVPLTDDPDLHLLADRQRIDGVAWQRDRWMFRLCASPAVLRIQSRSGVPAEQGMLRDPRELGVALRRIVLRRAASVRVVEADDASLVHGFYPFETDNGIRWTNGDALVPPSLYEGLGAPLELELQVAATTSYVLSEAVICAAA